MLDGLYCELGYELEVGRKRGFVRAKDGSYLEAIEGGWIHTSKDGSSGEFVSEEEIVSYLSANCLFELYPEEVSLCNDCAQFIVLDEG